MALITIVPMSKAVTAKVVGLDGKLASATTIEHLSNIAAEVAAIDDFDRMLWKGAGKTAQFFPSLSQKECLFKSATDANTYLKEHPTCLSEEMGVYLNSSEKTFDAKKPFFNNTGLIHKIEKKIVLNQI